MSDAVQLEENGTATADGLQSKDSGPVSDYHVLPYSERNSQQDLFGYRSGMEEPKSPSDQENAPKQAKRKLPVAILPILAILALVALAVLTVPKLLKPKTAAGYMDLGARRFDPAGLGGRLIVRWQGSAAYQLYIDPIDPQQAAAFQAVAMNPPHPISLVIRLLNTSGEVECQKEILLPSPAPPTGSEDPDQAMLPMPSTSGDTVQNIPGANGAIAEITMSGGLPCSLKTYQNLTGWDFFTNFPTLSEQAEWLKHHGIGTTDAEKGRRSGSTGGGNGFNPRIQRLPAPIDGDDVIVGDNPVRGTIDTSGGRVFFVGASGMRTRSAEWQVFPAAIHFRCEKSGSCLLTRENSRTTLQARLIR